jgi:hypothetical protein
MPSVIAKFGADTKPFQGGLDEMRSATQRWTGDIKGMIAGAFAAGTVINFFSQMRQEIARAVDLAQRFDTSAESIQRVGNAAKLAGSDIELVAKQMTKMTIEAANSGDKLEALGINAEEFVNTDMEGKLLLLAGAYEGASDSQERMILLMELLGNRGQDILPLLAGGAAELKRQFDEVPVVMESSAQVIAQFDDALDGILQNMQAFVGGMVGVIATVGAFWQTLLGGGSQAEMTAKFDKAFIEIWGEKPTDKKKRPGFDPDSLEATKKAASGGETDSERAANKLEETYRRITMERLSGEERISALEQQKQQAQDDYDNAAADQQAARYEAATRIFEIEEKIGKEQAEIAKAEAKAAEDIAKAKKDKADAVAKSAAALKTEEDRQALQAMSPAAQAAELRKRQAALYAESKRAAESGDSVRANEMRLDGLRMNDDISRADKAALPDLSGTGAMSRDAARPSIVASSLASIGGGGGVFISGADPQVSELRTHTSLLQQLVNLQRQTTDNPQAPYQL